MVKRLSTMWEIWVQSLGQEDPLEKEMATHSTILASEIPWMQEPGGLCDYLPSVLFIYLFIYKYNAILVTRVLQSLWNQKL